MIELFKGIKVDWLGKRKLFFSISIALAAGWNGFADGQRGISVRHWILRAERSSS